MKNILTGRMRKVLFIAVCIRSSLWGEICYSAETGRILSGDRKSTRLNSSHTDSSRMPSSA